jgi:hypothetical protein
VLERWEFKVEYEEDGETGKENVDSNVSAQKRYRDVSNKVNSFYFCFPNQLPHD